LNTHEQYEELCALAASGQASPDELTELRSHLEDCPTCRSAAYDFTQISAQGLSQLAAKRLHCEIPSGMTQRFVARARSEGIEMSREKSPSVPKPPRNTVSVAACAIVAVALVAGLLVVGKQKSSRFMASPQQSVALPIQTSTADSSTQSPPNQDVRLRQELVSLRSEITSMEATIQKQRTQLESIGQANSSLTSRLTDQEEDNTKIRSEKAQLEARLTGLEADLAKSKSDKSSNDAVVAVEEAELRELRNKLADEQAALDQQEVLAARGSDVRDLVVARNLHIIDVHDRDGDGKNQRAFGRIFYTEGKSLIFYAYDLADPRKVDAKVSFCVWGGRLGTEKPISNLGVFHSDDAKDGRWVLALDDPSVLAQINFVFVTVESSRKVVKEPGGKRILFAFLGDKPNHP
jgi:hypothetical protein